MLLAESANGPIGETDSEKAFCHILNSLESARVELGIPILETNRIADYISRISLELRELGPFNFILSNGAEVFAHGHIRTQKNGELRDPGLYVLSRNCTYAKDMESISGLSFSYKDSELQQNVILVASVPLTNEPWVPLAKGEIVQIKDGVIINSSL